MLLKIFLFTVDAIFLFVLYHIFGAIGLVSGMVIILYLSLLQMKGVVNQQTEVINHHRDHIERTGVILTKLGEEIYTLEELLK